MIKRTIFCWILLLLNGISFSQKKQNSTSQPLPYFPSAQNWEHRSASEFGIDSTKINEAISIAKAAETKNPRNMEISHYQSFGKEPFGEGIGPFAERGDPTGIIVYKG